MAKYYLTVLVVRVLQPVGLLLSISLRPFGLSLIYLLLYLIAPLVSIPHTSTIQGCSGKWLLINVLVAFLMLLVHAAWHVVLASFHPYGSLLQDYPIIRTIGRNLGLVSFAKIEPFLIIRYLSPEVAICISSVLVNLLTRRLVRQSQESPPLSKYRRCPRLVSAGKYLCLLLLMLSGIMRPSVTSGIYFLVFMGAATAWALGRRLERGFAVVARCLMAIMACHVAVLLVYQNTWLTEMYPPQEDMARYFGLTKLVTLRNSTDFVDDDFKYTVEEDQKWGTLASPLVILITYFILALESRELFKPKKTRKLGGLESRLNGSLARGFSFHRTASRHTRDKWKSATKKVRVSHDRLTRDPKETLPYINMNALRGAISETTPSGKWQTPPGCMSEYVLCLGAMQSWIVLIACVMFATIVIAHLMLRSVSPSKRLATFARNSSRTMHQDSTGSVVVVDHDSDDAVEPTLSEDILQAVIDFFDVMIRSSYIATTITMMAWSIIFHSWLSFVFLMWANIVWLMQDQRSFMLKTSPILVCYAMFLLISQYIYGMDLTTNELPEIKEVNLDQIGFSRPSGEPCVPLLIKSLLTCMFWVTLRQWIQEMRQKKQAALLTDMAAPMQLTVSTAASALEAQREQETRSRLLRKVGEVLRTLCARYWIYVVVIMLFVIGITGERMTIFRIIYMFLFLAFILMFQISWYWWRRLMYIFWITVIIYSMINLILIYIYQFDNFSKTIEEYLMINERLQHDLGLSRYNPADLFVKLLTPTAFLIITIMQVHYFHKDFMELSATKGRLSSSGPSRVSSRRSNTVKDDASVPPLPLEEERRAANEAEDTSFTDAGPSVTTSMRRKASSRARSGVTNPSSTMYVWVKRGLLNFKAKLMDWTDKIFVFLEIHLIKIIMLALMLLCVANVCAMHVPIFILICPGLLLRPRRQRHIVLFISILISIYFMAKMVYQIDYIQHSIFAVDCQYNTNDSNPNATFSNNADWIGFHKASHEKPLAVLVKSYIALIALFTFYSLVMYRQKSIRENLVEPRAVRKDRVIFPEVNRVDADKDLPHCIKYFINYGFYKFGVEITLICLMGVIGSRMDLYAVFYAGWLLVLVSISRIQQSFVWNFFTAFITFIVPFQYLLAVGFMPQFCINYPWSGKDGHIRDIRTWLFLPYAPDPPHAIKLIFDYFLLLFASRQLRVFSLEKGRGDAYPGGSNKEDIGGDWETPSFVNPVPDFLSYVSSWLDVIKRMVFLGMLWMTLAIMFMTGTSRVNLFSMGYLVGSFIFLWQGTDFYLLPKKSILRWWSWLLLYNVSVVGIKALLQIPGCMFSEIMQEHACWLVQLLGIGCVDKFAGGNIAAFIKMTNYSKESTCMVPQEDIGLAWDGVCFAFLILQRRLFRSYYFYRVIDESKATTILASRGAELIEELRQKQMGLQEEQEKKILEKIKVKMERIKANQRKMQIVAKEPRHHDDEEDEEETQEGESEQVPLVRGDSETSGRGYHTPDSPASPRGFHTPISEASAPPSPAHTPPLSQSPPPAPPPGIPVQPGAGPPSPSSALMTASMSLDAYLEPRRISFGSPPSSELLPRAQSPEESYPVFSPPPIRRRHTVASPSLLQRTSIISQSSRVEPNSHHTSGDRPPYKQPTSHQKAIRSGDYYMFDEFDDTDLHDKDDEEESDEDVPKEMGFGKLLATAFKTDLKRAVSLRRASAPNIRSARQASLSSYPHSYAHEEQRSMSPRSSRIVRETDINVTTSDQEMEEFAEQAEGEHGIHDKIRDMWETVCAFVQSILVTLTRHVIKYSRDYRYISRTLTQEKKRLKEREGFGIGLRENAQMRWEPLPDAIVIENRKLSEISVPEIRILAPSMERGLDASPLPSPRASPQPSPTYDDTTSEHESAFSLQTTESKDVTMLEEQDDSLFKHGKNPFIHLMYALWYAVLAHTDVVCYMMVFINQIQSATILSIPLPLMVFLWGTLTIPRPTKTFWVTLIAYTEVIVLIKSMFQFEILPWNQKAIPENMPFTAPRIIGIERKSNYAIYDLLLLLIIFLHRFMLKSLGLWKESAPEIELRDDMEYTLAPEDTQLLVEGQGEEVGRKYVKLHDKEGPDGVPGSGESSHKSTSAAEGKPELEPGVGDTPNSEGLRRRKTSSPKEPTAGPSKPSDDDHYQVHDDDEPIIAVTTTIESPYKHFPKVVVLSLRRYLRPAERFFRRMTASGARVTADVYAYMFLCDFFNFLVVIFGFAAFGTHQGDGGVQAYLEENKVPIPFLVMLILQFGLIIIDRALYLRKYMLGKILFQYALVMGVHIWMFFVLPYITERTFNALIPPPMWYMLKCIYLLLSAYQIRCGYPRRIIGNFLCKSYRFLNMLAFRGFMAVPFVFELRTLMDWIWTDTSMTLVDWLKMEDIFASVYLLKCSRYVEDEFPAPRGVKKTTSSKYILGGTVLAFVIAIIWFPLVFFAFGNTVGEPNPPKDVTVKIRIGPFLPVYQMSAQSHNIDMFTEQDYTQLSNLYGRDRTAQTFLSNYMYNDVAVVTINPNSTSKWTISPPELERLENEALSNASLAIRFTFIITHETNAAANPPTIEDYREVHLAPYVDGKRNPEREMLTKLLTGTAGPEDWLNVTTLFPKFLKVFNKGSAKPAYQLIPSPTDLVTDDRLYRDVQLRLERQGGEMYWRVRESCIKDEAILSSIPMHDCSMLIMYTFNDKLFPETLNFISGSGIIGLYTTFVFLASRVIRGFFSGIYTKIMFDDLPNVDRVLQLCLDIYLVREAVELTLEEDLFAKLVFLYRSPETMIKWTRPKEEEGEPQRALPPP